jgi:hypothetical protein
MYEKNMGIFCLGCEPKEIEEIRHFRTIKAEIKANKLIQRAARLEIEADSKAAPLEAMRGDHAFFTQPGRIPYRDKIFKSFNKSAELNKEADQILKRAENIMHYKTIVAGDAERKRQAKREALDQIIQKGSRVHDFAFGDGVVIGVYKKSYRIQFDRGYTYSRDKSYVQPLGQSLEPRK